MLKYWKYALIAIAALEVNLNVIAQETNFEYSINFKMKGIADGVKGVLIKNNAYNMADTISVVESKNEEFNFQGTTNSEGQFVFIKLDTTNVKLNENMHSYVRLMIDGGAKIIVESSVSEWPKAKISGSNPTTEYEKFLIENSNFSAGFNSSDTAVRNESKMKYKFFLLNYAKQNPHSFVSPFCVLNGAALIGVSEIQSVYDGLSDRVKKSFYGNRLTEYIRSAQNRTELGVGKLIPNFPIETLDGRKGWMRDEIAKSELTLIDFWAWWCGPCKEDVPNMKKTYDEFKNKGFNIIGVSIDRDKVKWKSAISADQLNWLQVLDSEKAAEIVFGLASIPGYILVNRKGIVLFVDCGISKFPNEENTFYVKSKNNLRQYLFETVNQFLSNE